MGGVRHRPRGAVACFLPFIGATWSRGAAAALVALARSGDSALGAAAPAALRARSCLCRNLVGAGAQAPAWRGWIHHSDFGRQTGSGSVVARRHSSRRSYCNLSRRAASSLTRTSPSLVPACSKGQGVSIRPLHEHTAGIADYLDDPEAGDAYKRNRRHAPGNQQNCTERTDCPAGYTRQPSCSAVA